MPVANQPPMSQAAQYAPSFELPDEQRVVVTGLGTICPVGNDVATAWQALIDGRSGIGPITKFDTEPFDIAIAGEIRDFHPEEVIAKKELRRMSTPARYAVVAAQEAVADAGLVVDESNDSKTITLVEDFFFFALGHGHRTWSGSLSGPQYHA